MLLCPCQITKILKHIPQVVDIDSHLGMVFAVCFFVYLKRTLIMLLCAFQITKFLKHQPQVVDNRSHVGMVFAIY